MTHLDHERITDGCPECEAEQNESYALAGRPAFFYSRAEIQEGFDLKREIRSQRHEGQAVIAPLSMLRCSECGELLDAYGCCVLHGLIDTEAMDGYAG